MRVDVFHDTVCPWCRIGKQHLKLALERWEGEAVSVHYHTFFLNPDIPAEGYPFREYMKAKGGGQIPLEQWFAAPREMGQRVGLTFNFEKIGHAPNSALSHQLILLTPEAQRETVIDAVYAAYFEDGQNIGDLDVLLEIAAKLGLDNEAIRPQLEQNAKYDEVMADAIQGVRIGISGVPFFIVNQRLGFSGAQPPEVILDVLRQTQESGET